MIHRNDARACSVKANLDLNKKALKVADEKIVKAAKEGFYTCILNFIKDFGQEGCLTGKNLKQIFYYFFEELEKSEFQYELRSTEILIFWRFGE